MTLAILGSSKGQAASSSHAEQHCRGQAPDMAPEPMARLARPSAKLPCLNSEPPDRFSAELLTAAQAQAGNKHTPRNGHPDSTVSAQCLVPNT